MLYIIGTNKEIEVEHESLSQEDAMIKYDLYEKLSEEAKEVISIIINAPPELYKLGIITNSGRFKKRNGDSAHYLKCYFRAIWGSRLLVRRVFKELEIFAKTIY